MKGKLTIRNDKSSFVENPKEVGKESMVFNYPFIDECGLLELFPTYAFDNNKKKN